MMKHFFVILIGCLWLAIPLFAQSNKLRLSSSMMFRVVAVMVSSPFCVFCFLTFFGQRMRTPRKAVPS